MSNEIDIELLATQYWSEGNYTAQVQLVVDALRGAGLPVVVVEEPNYYCIYVGAQEKDACKWVVYSYKESRMKRPAYHLYLQVNGGQKIPLGPMNQVSTIVSFTAGSKEEDRHDS